MAEVLVTTKRFTSGMAKILRICCVRSIWSPFGLAYLPSIWENTSNLRSAYVNSKFDILSFAVDSWRLISAFVRTVSRINANSFIGYLLFLILVVHVVEIRSTISMPTFVWSYNLCMSGFLLSSFVAFNSSWFWYLLVYFYDVIALYQIWLFYFLMLIEL